MEDKELLQFRANKPHNSKEVLEQLWNNNNNVHQIAKLLHISTKLVHIKLREYGIY